jgi:hypothetical protein
MPVLPQLTVQLSLLLLLLTATAAASPVATTTAIAAPFITTIATWGHGQQHNNISTDSRKHGWQ